MFPRRIFDIRTDWTSNSRQEWNPDQGPEMSLFVDAHDVNPGLLCQLFHLPDCEGLTERLPCTQAPTAAFISLIMKIAETHLFSCFIVDNSPKNVHPIVFIQIDRDILGPKHRELTLCFGFKFVQEIQIFVFYVMSKTNPSQILTIFIVRFQTISWSVTAVP